MTVGRWDGGTVTVCATVVVTVGTAGQMTGTVIRMPPPHSTVGSNQQIIINGSDALNYLRLKIK